MEKPGLLLIGLVIIGTLVVVAFRHLSRSRILKKRSPISLTEMYSHEMNEADVSFDTFQKVLNIIGKSYNLDPRRLRLSDELKLLYDLDTWDIDEGTQSLNEQIMKEYGISKFDIEPQTISDLIIDVESRLKA